MYATANDGSNIRFCSAVVQGAEPPDHCEYAKEVHLNNVRRRKGAWEASRAETRRDLEITCAFVVM